MSPARGWPRGHRRRAFLLTVSGLGDYATIHDGLLLQNPCIFLMMAARWWSHSPVGPFGGSWLRGRVQRRHTQPVSAESEVREPRTVTIRD